MKFARMRGVIPRWLAWCLVGVGTVLATTPFWIPRVSVAAGHALLAKAPRPHIVHHVAALPEGAPFVPAPATPAGPSGQVVATLSIPALSLVTAVLQGTSDATLLAAPGHYAASVMPGQVGTSVIAAHNATFFRHLNRLRIGDRIVVTTSQGRFVYQVAGHQVVHHGEGVVDTPYASLLLEACYPLNALYLTPDRYVVEAVPVSDQLAAGVAPRLASANQVASVQAAIPAAVATNYPLWLSQNSIPMGELTEAGATGVPLVRFQQSSQPIAVEEQAIRLWNAVRFVSQADNAKMLASLVPASAAPAVNPYWHAAQVSFPGVMNVAETLSSAGIPTAVRLTDTDVQIDGQRWSISLTAVVQGQTLRVGSWSATRVP